MFNNKDDNNNVRPSTFEFHLISFLWIVSLFVFFWCFLNLMLLHLLVIGLVIQSIVKGKYCIHHLTIKFDDVAYSFFFCCSCYYYYFWLSINLNIYTKRTKSISKLFSVLISDWIGMAGVELCNFFCSLLLWARAIIV